MTGMPASRTAAYCKPQPGGAAEHPYCDAWVKGLRPQLCQLVTAASEVLSVQNSSFVGALNLALAFPDAVEHRYLLAAITRWCGALRYWVWVWVTSVCSAVLGCRGRCRGRAGCRCTARRPASRRRIGGGVVGHRGPRGPSAGGRARRRPPRARVRALGRPFSRRAGRVGVTGCGLVGLSPVRALGTLTSWGDGEWAVVGCGLSGIAVAALRSPNTALRVHLRRSAGWSLRIVRGRIRGAASVPVRGRGERLGSGARC